MGDETIELIRRESGGDWSARSDSGLYYLVSEWAVPSPATTTPATSPALLSEDFLPQDPLAPPGNPPPSPAVLERDTTRASSRASDIETIEDAPAPRSPDQPETGLADPPDGSSNLISDDVAISPADDPPKDGPESIEVAGVDADSDVVLLSSVVDPADTLRRVGDFLARTLHPCLPHTYLLGRHPDLPFDLFFIEYDPAGDWLLSLTTSPSDVCRIGGQLAQLLSACHSSGIAIVSLRPEAVRWSRASGRATVVRLEGVSPLQSPAQPRTWGVATAPEILLGHPTTTAADVYSLGIVLASCLGMLRPEPGDEPNVLDGFSARGHVDLSALVMRCASPNPMDRPALKHVARELGRLRGAFDAVLAVDTTIGRVRDVQEDSWAALTISGAAPDSSVTVAAIADGMGGAEAGEVASRLAVRTFLSSISAALESLDDLRLDGSTIDGALAAAFAEASSRIQAYAREHPERRDLGTTLTGIVIAGGAVRVGHAGDTRCTLVRDGTVAQLTTDHTVVARLVEIGEIDETEALSHPQRSTLYRSLGGERPTEPELSSFDLQDGDWLILTTDGVHGLVSGKSFVEATASWAPAQVARALVNEAVLAGGHDNATAICVNVLAAAPQE